MYANKKQEQFILNAKKQKAEKEKKKAVSTQKANGITKNTMPTVKTTRKKTVDEIAKEMQAEKEKQTANYDKAYAKDDFIGTRMANANANLIRQAQGVQRVDSSVGDMQHAKSAISNGKALQVQNSARLNTAQTLKPKSDTVNTGYEGRGQYQDSDALIERLKASTAKRAMAGAVQGFTPINADYAPKVQSYLESSGDAYNIGKIGGVIGSFTTGYGALGKGVIQGATKIAPKAIPKLTGTVAKGITKVLPKLSQETAGKIGQGIVQSGIKDIAIGAPLNLNYAANKEGLRGKDLAKSMALNTALDLGVGGLMEFAPIVLKSGKKVTSSTEISKLPTAEKVEAIRKVNASKPTYTKNSLEAKNQAMQAENIELGTNLPQAETITKSRTFKGQLPYNQLKTETLKGRLNISPPTEAPLSVGTPIINFERGNRGTIAKDIGDGNYLVMFENKETGNKALIKMNKSQFASTQQVSNDLEYARALDNTKLHIKSPKFEGQTHEYPTDSIAENITAPTQQGLKDTQEYKLSGKSGRYQKRGENKFISNVASSLGVSKYADKKGLKSAVNELSEKLKNGDITETEKAQIFNKMYDDGIVVSDQFYNTYKPLKDRLNSITLKVTDAETKNIADFETFRKNHFNNIRMSKADGVSIDGLYQDLKGEYPELFPEVNTTGEMLENIADVNKSIKKTEQTLGDAYGSQADEMKAYAKHEFDKAFEKLSQNARVVQKYDAEKVVKKEMQTMSVPEIKQLYKDSSMLQREVDKMNNSTLLNSKDRVQVDRLLKGEITIGELPNGVNVPEIKNMYEVKKQLQDVQAPIKEYNKAYKAGLRENADNLLANSDDWKDKKTGFQYAREMEERNFVDVAGSVDGEKLIKQYITPVHKNEAMSNTFKTSYRDKVRALNLGDKEIYNADGLYGTMPSATKSKVSESALVQMYGEGKITAEQLQSVGANVEKIQRSATAMKQSYDELIDSANDVLIRNGYKPIDYRKDYFPHFTDSEPDSVLGKIASKLGFNIQIDELPTDIAGLTHTFKPGKKWFGFGLQRQTENTVYDAVKGFDLYIEGISDIIHHTDDIQRLRALENSIRYKYSKDGIKSEIDEILNSDMPDSLKESSLDDVYGRDKTHLGNLAVHVREYTDNLAGKKALEDRNMEHQIGRSFYNISKAMENRVAANMVAVNPASWLTNFIPLVQGTEVKSASTIKALGTTLRSYINDDGFSKMSNFLINRRGSEPLWSTKLHKVSDTLSSPMRYIDNFTSEVLTRAKYYDEISKGASHDSAIDSADKFAASVIADRSKGGLPTIFNAKNPVSKLMTMFQVEVNNQFSYLLKDLPRNSTSKVQLTNSIAKYMLGAYAYNTVYESLIGRRPALDPLGMIQDTYENATDENKSKTQAAQKLGTDVLGSLPFVGGLLGGGRIPISNALPNVATLGTSLTGLATGEMNQKKALNNIGKELQKPAFYILPPTGGGQLKKMYESVKTVGGNGSYGMDADGRDKLQFAVDKTPANYVKSAVFGKYSLPGAKEWVEDGFKTMSADATQGYKDSLKLGMKPNDYVEYYNEAKSYKPIKDSDGKTVTSKPTQIREMIINSDATAEQKQVLDRALVKSDKVVDYSSRENYAFSLLPDKTQERYAKAKDISKDVFTKSYLAQKDEKLSISKAYAVLEVGNEQTAKALGIGDTAILNARIMAKKGIEPSYYEKYKKLADADGDKKITAFEAHQALKGETLTDSQYAFLVRILQGTAPKK